MLAADQFRDRIDLVGRERDNRGSARLPRDLAVAGEFKLRQSRPGDDRGARQQPLDDGTHGRSPQQQRLVATAPVQDAIGEDMPAFEIGCDLDFVDGEKTDVDIARHRLDGGDPVARIFRLDLLFAGDQRDRFNAGAIRDLVVDLARQEPQRQADDPGRMRQHPLDRQMRLAGVGRPEDCGDAGAGSAFVGERGMRESHILRVFLASRLFQGVSLCDGDAVALKLWNESGTNRVRIADSTLDRLRSPQHLAWVRSRRH